MLPRRCFADPRPCQPPQRHPGYPSHVYVLDGVVEPSPTYWFAEAHPDGQRFRISGRQGRDRELEILSFARSKWLCRKPESKQTSCAAVRAWCPRRGLCCAHDTVVTTVEGTQQVISQSPVASRACLSQKRLGWASPPRHLAIYSFDFL